MSPDFAEPFMEENGEPRELTLLSESRRLLAEATTIDEVKLIRDKAEALRAYAKQHSEGLEIQNAAAEVRIRAERRGGELIREMIESGVLRGPGGDRKSKGHDVLLKLSDIGIDLHESKRWQRIHSLEEKKFEDFIRSTKGLGKELTTASLLRLANGERSPPFPRPYTLDEATEVMRRAAVKISWKWPREHRGMMVDLLRSLADELAELGEIRS
jgi:hypothetical protein